MGDHTSVLFAESLAALNIKQDGCYVDCTFGRGGHSRGILERLGKDGRLLALDRDLAAIESDAAVGLNSDPRFELKHASISELDLILEQKGWSDQVDGVLMDLGVSSPQLDEAERGFSFLRDGALDMRMDRSRGVSAADWLASIDEKRLIQVLFEYGEERFARRIAANIVSVRAESPILTTFHLVKVIEEAIPFREKHKHPATRSFQAIRIEINQELEELKQGLLKAVAGLATGGRLAVISFHSLEDRLVKRFIRDESGKKNNPGRLPVLEKDIETGVLKKIAKPVKAGNNEIQNNPRARSAVLRVAEKIKA